MIDYPEVEKQNGGMPMSRALKTMVQPVSDSRMEILSFGIAQDRHLRPCSGQAPSALLRTGTSAALRLRVITSWRRQPVALRGLLYHPLYRQLTFPSPTARTGHSP